MARADLFGWLGTKWAKITATEQDGKIAADVNDVLASGPVVITGLNNANVNSNVEGQEIDFSKYRHLTVRYMIGGGTGTLQLKVQYKAVDGTWIDDTDLAQTASVASGAGKAFDGYYVNYSTIRVYATITGSLTGVTCVISMKS